MNEFQDKIKEIHEKVKSNGIVINRIPKKTKDEFVAIANEEFSEDYGMCLKWCIEQALEYQSIKITFFENIDMKLNDILEKVSQNEQKEKKPEVKSIRMISGRIVKGGKENE